MSDAYWRYGDSRQPPPTSTIAGKRPRPDYDAPGERGAPAYYPRDGEGVPHQTFRDTESINASYDRYLRSGHLPSQGGAESDRTLTSGLPSHSLEDPRMSVNPHIAGDHRLGMDPTTGNDSRISSMDPLVSMKGRNFAIGSGRPEILLPPDASNTLFVEGLPANCTRREVAHIFRPFVGYQEVRLVIKEPKYPGGSPAVLCFVDFASPAHAATTLDALQAQLQVLLLFHAHSMGIGLHASGVALGHCRWYRQGPLKGASEFWAQQRTRWRTRADEEVRCQQDRFPGGGVFSLLSILIFVLRSL